jgi:hypothetical protein
MPYVRVLRAERLEQLQVDRDGNVRLALGRSEAAAALGMSLRHFQRHVQPYIRTVYSGQLRLYSIKELERWLEANASKPHPRPRGEDRPS